MYQSNPHAGVAYIMDFNISTDISTHIYISIHIYLNTYTHTHTHIYIYTLLDINNTLLLKPRNKLDAFKRWHYLFPIKKN